MSEATAWLQQHANWPVVHDFFSDVGGPIGWWLLLQFVVLLAGTQRGLRLAWFVWVAGLTNTWLKWLWADPRPYWIDDSVSAIRASQGFGMPSGHAQGAMSVWLGLWLALDRHRTKALLALVVTFVIFTGVSRVYYGVHSVAQVLVGFGFGLSITLVLAWLIPRLETWLRPQSLSFRSVFALCVLGLAALLSWIVYLLRADFVAPQAWRERFEATQIQLGHTGELGDMGLTHEGSGLLVAILAGYALLALVASERGHRVALTRGSRVNCILAAIVINCAVLALLQQLDAGVAVAAVWLLVQPLAGLWLPLHLFGQRAVD